MRRLLHWQYIVPRVLLVIVALMGLQYVCGLAARSLAVRSGEAVLGARVEVGYSRVSLADRQVVFNDLRIADPHRPSQSFLEADRCEWKLAAAPLAHKRAVVESGRVSGLRIGPPADIGAKSKSLTGAAERTAAWFQDDADLVAGKWLKSLNEQFTLELVKQFDAVQRTDVFCAEWSKQSASLDSRLQELDNRATALQDAVEAAQANPLRNDKLLDDLRKQIAALQKESAAFRADVDKLPDLLENGRRAIVCARRHDDDVIGQRLHFEPVEANALTAYLLREQTARQLNQLVGWLRWLHNAAPVGRALVPDQKRGENVLFAGCRPEPGVLIRSLQFEGVTRIGKQPVELRGLVTNFASEPQLHNEPLRLRVVGSGSMPLELQATIDRTGQVARDELLIDCQGVLLPPVSLGRSDQLEMQLAPSVGSLSLSIVVEGEKLTGDVQMVQQQVQVTPVLNGSGGNALTSSMGETLGHVNSIATRLSLNGTLDEPKCVMWSNLGAAVAEALKRGLHRAGDQHAHDLLVEAGRRVDERLAEVDRQVAEKQAHFAGKTTDITVRLQKIAAGETPRYRISDEKGGRRLPNNSLFR